MFKLKSRMFYRLAAFLTVILLTSSLSGYCKSKATGSVKIGLIYPMSGTAAKTGAEYVAAYKLAADIINGKYPNINLPFAKNGGLPKLNGAKIEFEVADHKASPEVGLAETERLITNKKVIAVMGSHYSAVTKTASSAAERLKIPFFCPDSTAKSLTERGFQWFFRSGPHDGTFINDTFDFLDYLNKSKRAAIKSVAIISEDTEFGALATDLEQSEAKKRKYQIAQVITYPANSANVVGEVIKLKNSKADAVLMASYTSDAILFMKTFKEQGFTPKAIIGQRAGFIAPEFFTSLGTIGDYVFTTNVFALDLSNAKPMIKKINDLFKERTGTDLTGDYARAFTGIFVLADAINRAGSTKPEAIRKALLKTNIAGEQLIVPWKGVKFDPKTHQNIYAAGIVTQAIQGEYYTVFPQNLAAKQVMWPVPAWDKR
jgi:branched-chain amino acid transport system substrate-binding protein